MYEMYVHISGLRTYVRLEGKLDIFYVFVIVHIICMYIMCTYYIFSFYVRNVRTYLDPRTYVRLEGKPFYCTVYKKLN